jgi:hypothetical protein
LTQFVPPPPSCESGGDRVMMDCAAATPGTDCANVGRRISLGGCPGGWDRPELPLPTADVSATTLSLERILRSTSRSLSSGGAAQLLPLTSTLVSRLRSSRVEGSTADGALTVASSSTTSSSTSTSTGSSSSSEGYRRHHQQLQKTRVAMQEHLSRCAPLSRAERTLLLQSWLAAVPEAQHLAPLAH